MGNFLVQMGEECEEMKLFINGSKLVVSKDSFFEGKDLFPIHVLVKFLLVSRFDRTLCSM